jgi:superoxide reductase
VKRRWLIGLGLASGGGLLLPRWLAAQPSIHVGGPMAGGVYHTRESPGLWESLVREHVPKLDKTQAPGGGVTIRVTTEHEMDGFEHYIVKHSLLDGRFRVLGQKSFDPRRDRQPQSTYSLLPGYKGPVFALSMCNRHDLWLEGILV